ncbi:hypothetical protein [Senegalia massiliensis]|uniref:hypothetical protein n=1 Tax=Senegalia massiliensis TaxID=1720316 RepID=UPI0010310DF2|nr:hypothetical protein [Senegalia massiliensis]
MSNKIKQEINKIEIPKELHERSKMGILKVKNERYKNRKNYKFKNISLVAGVIVLIGVISIYNNWNQNNNIPKQGELIVNEDGSIKIPKIQLSDDLSHADMIGLIVYNGKIYTQTTTEIKSENAKKILGEMLGTTKGNIDEWSNQNAYDEEFASTIGETDVYSVKGYDEEFRIMTYKETEGKSYAEFYESLNGITVHDGEDIFGKLKMSENVLNAKYRIFSDWDNSIDNYHSISNMDAVNSFIEYLNNAKPLLRESNSDPIRNSRNNEEYRNLIIELNDGSKVNLTLIKGGYIYYGYMNIYFKMNENEFLKIWNEIK